MARRNPRPHEQPGTGAEDIPPGATRKAWQRKENTPGGPPGSGAGPRHMAGDPGDGNELTEAVDRHREDDPSLTEEPARSDDREMGENATAYAGPSGGAVGGSPAEGRTSGGNIHHGLAPGGSHRGDSTIGAEPSPGGTAGKRRKRKS
jgi:hypothetical protein